MPDTIYIIGAGAIGQALAVALKHHGREVVLVRATVQDGDHQRKKIGLEIGEAGIENIEAHIDIYPLRFFKRFDGPLVFTNKSYGNQMLAQELRPLAGDREVILLQNGLGIERPFVQLNYPEVYRCVLFITSQITNDTIRLKPVAASQIGSVTGDASRLNDVVTLLNTPTFPFAKADNLQQMIWKKAIANSVFNSICPLLDIDNGIFHRDPASRAFAARVVTECVHIAGSAGITLSEEEVMKMILHISRSSDGQLISTLQDIRAKRETEISTLNLEIARMADEQNLSHAADLTRHLGELVLLKSGLAMNKVNTSGSDNR